jgi:hypothetical protein
MAEETKEQTAGEKQRAEAEELNKRTESFNAELIPLLKKYELGLSAQPFIFPNGTIGARPIIFNDRKPADAVKVDEPKETKLSEG